MVRWSSLVGVCFLVMALLTAPGMATACACGGVLSSDPSLQVADELALVTGDGVTETVVMRLNLSTSAADAALVIPTPAPATVTAAPHDLFDHLEELSAPRIETVTQWTVGWGGFGSASDGVTAGAPGSGPGDPAVLAQVQLGPLEATTLSGGDLTGVRKWLSANGYDLHPEISAGLSPYLSDGWSVVAMRLTTDDASLDGPLAPVRLTFPHAAPPDELIYPMRMSAHAKSPQTATIYTLGEHRMMRTDDDVALQAVDQDYAGSIAGRTEDPTLAELSSAGTFLTKVTTSIVDPAEITSDFVFAQAPTDEPFQRVVRRYETVDLTLPAMGAAVVLVVAAAVLAGAVLTRRVRRRPTAR